jgi:hypothetical protein
LHLHVSIPGFIRTADERKFRLFDQAFGCADAPFLYKAADRLVLKDMGATKIRTVGAYYSTIEALGKSYG